MALSTYDDSNLSASDKKKVSAYQVAYATAQAAGDTAGMESAHAAAEAIRGNYDYSGGSDGSRYISTKKEEYPTPSGPKTTNKSKQIGDMYDANLVADQQRLYAARDQANSDYQAQIDAAPQEFQPARNQVDLNMVRNLQATNEAAAAKGLAHSQGSVSDQAGIRSSAGQQKTALNQQEINLVQELKRAIADNNKATSYEDVAMTAENTALKTGALIDEANRVEQWNYNNYYDSANLGLQQKQVAIQESGVTGQYQGQATMASKAFDYQKERDQVADKQYSDAMDYQKERDTVADEQWKTSFEQSVKDAKAGRAIQWANLSLSREQFEWSKDPTNPDNIMTLATGESKDFKDMFGRAWDMLNVTTKVYDRDSDSLVERKAFTAEDVARMIDASSLSDDEALSMRRMLGIPDDFTQ